MVRNKEIISFLRSKSITAGFIDTLKIRYRPLVCPFNELFNLVNDGDRVFDIGCGSGQFALLLAHFTKVSAVAGIEISERLVRNANELFEREKPGIPYSFTKFDGAEIPAEAATYDLFFLIDVLHHVPGKKQQDFLNEIFRKMRPGSRLVLKDINGSSPLVVFNKIHDLVFSSEIGKERGVERAKQMALKAGFEIISTFRRVTAVYPHYFLILKKH